MAEDDAHALGIARELIGRARLDAGRRRWPDGPAPRYDPEELLGLFRARPEEPVDMRDVIARIVDGSDFLEFKPALRPGHRLRACGRSPGHRVGIVTNNGPIDPAGSTKVTHFIQACCQTGLPIVYLQNTTGFIVGTEAERAGMIKHGSQA